MRTTRYGCGTAYSTPNTWLVSCLSREKEEELRLSTRYSDSRGMGLLKRWVVVRVEQLASPSRPWTSTVLCARPTYTHVSAQSCLSREKEEELRLSTRYSDSRGIGL